MGLGADWMAFYSGLFVPDRKILGAEVLNPIIAKSPFTALPRSRLGVEALFKPLFKPCSQ